MTGKYYINGLDAYLTYGLVFRKGTNSELLSMPGAWPDETRKMALPIVIEGKDESDFWVKYNAFRSFITSGDDFTFLAENLHRRYKVSYESMSSFKTLTHITGGGKVYCDFVLNLIDDYPDVYTYARSGSFQKNNSPIGYVGSTVSFTRTYSSFSLADATALGNADTTFNAGGQAYANANGTNIPVLDHFISLVLADGGTVDSQLLNTLYYG